MPTEAQPAPVQAPAAPPEAEPATAVQPRAPAAAAAKASAGKDAKGAKQGKAAKQGKGEKGTVSDASEDEPSIAAHPRAVRAVARTKSWAGLAGFFVGGYLSLPTNTIAAAGLRALIAGVVCYVAAWAGAVFLWRRLVMLELKGREQQLLSAAARPPRELPPAPPPRARTAA
jgi:hypothetical protein